MPSQRFSNFSSFYKQKESPASYFDVCCGVVGREAVAAAVHEWDGAASVLHQLLGAPQAATPQVEFSLSLCREDPRGGFFERGCGEKTSGQPQV